MRPNSWTWLGQKSFPFCYSQWALLTDLPPPPLEQSGLKLVWNVNIVYGNLKSENSQNYAQKPQRNCTFMNSVSVLSLILCGRDERIDSAKNVTFLSKRMYWSHTQNDRHPQTRDDNTVQKNAGQKCTGCLHYIIQMFLRKGNKKSGVQNS